MHNKGIFSASSSQLQCSEHTPGHVVGELGSLLLSCIIDGIETVEIH